MVVIAHHGIGMVGVVVLVAVELLPEPAAAAAAIPAVVAAVIPDVAAAAEVTAVHGVLLTMPMINS